MCLNSEGLMSWVESKEAIGRVDELLASIGLVHGSRETLAGTWQGGERVKARAGSSVRSSGRSEPAGPRRSIAVSVADMRA